MAGVYQDFPARRLAYDVDGTNLYDIVSGVSTIQTQAQMQYMNDEDSDFYSLLSITNGTSRYAAFVFPVATNVVAYHLAFNGGSGIANWLNASEVAVSVDTTDGFNGTWVQVQATVTYTTSVAMWRDVITAISGGSNIKGIRFKFTKSTSSTVNLDISSLGLYGDPNALPAALHFWEPTTDQQLAKGALDFGDVAPGQVITRTFRLKNTSSQTANTVQLSAFSPTGAMGATVEFSVDGGAYTANHTFSSVAAGALTSVVTMRRTVQATGVTPGKYACRLQAIAGTWS